MQPLNAALVTGAGTRSTVGHATRLRLSVIIPTLNVGTASEMVIHAKSAAAVSVRPMVASRSVATFAALAQRDKKSERDPDLLAAEDLLGVEVVDLRTVVPCD